MNDNSKRPFVSIVIPVYNGGNYMREAIDSALAQTYDQIEIIVVNDGSSDDGVTDAIARGYGNKIRYFSKDNGGCASALNLGILNMRGDYFSWLSHDDVYLPEKIEHQIRVLSELPDKATIIYGGYEVINSKSRLLTTVRPDAALPVEKLDIPLLPLLRGLIHGCSLLIPRKYFQEIGFFDESLLSTQDYALWFEFFRIAPLHFDSRILIRSRVHPDQGTHKLGRHIEDCNKLWCGFLKRLNSDEMFRMEGSSYRFLIKTAEFLSATPYREAEQCAESMALRALADIKVSVVIPFFNRINLTIEAIRSVQAQSHQNFEILLVDDGSTDKLDNLIAVVQADDRITYVRQENAGPAKARNFGVSLAVGSYIAFLDSDDLFVEDKLRVQLEYMEQNGFIISHTSYDRIDIEGMTIDYQDSGKLLGMAFPSTIVSCPIAMPTVMCCTDILRNNPFPESLKVAEDICLWIRLTSKYELGGLDMGLSKVRVCSTTSSFDASKQVIGLINIAAYVVGDPFLAQYGKQVRMLLRNTWSYVSNSDGPSVAVVTKVERRRETVAMRIVRQIRKNGVRATFRRIRFLMGC